MALRGAAARRAIMSKRWQRSAAVDDGGQDDHVSLLCMVRDDHHGHVAGRPMSADPEECHQSVETSVRTRYRWSPVAMEFARTAVLG